MAYGFLGILGHLANYINLYSWLTDQHLFIWTRKRLKCLRTRIKYIIQTIICTGAHYPASMLMSNDVQSAVQWCLRLIKCLTSDELFYCKVLKIFTSKVAYKSIAIVVYLFCTITWTVFKVHFHRHPHAREKNKLRHQCIIFMVYTFKDHSF